MHKKMYISILMLILLISTFTLSLFFMTENTTVIASNTVVFKPTIVIDAGHGGEDGGAFDNDVVEKNINLKIAVILKDFFIKNGFRVVMIRESDTSLNKNNSNNKKRSDLENRVSIFNSDKNNIVISIHQNKFSESMYKGTQVFYSPNNSKSQKLAENIRTSVVRLLQPQNSRLCKQSGSEIYILHNTYVPAVLVECGFLSNKSEATQLSSESYQYEIAYSIFLGFLEYYKTNY